LLDRYQPASFSEHLAWSSHGGNFYNDLLPVAYDAATLERVCAHIGRVQDRLKRRMLLENPATYVEFAASTMDRSRISSAKWCAAAAAGLLLDVNNVHVSCTNHGRDARDYIGRPAARSGRRRSTSPAFAEDTDAAGAPVLIDSHGAPVAQVVWALYCHVTGP
jgi:uncharacterized protein (UPF0276 family)